ncbi:isocitrate/isopropylmalate family dehydrogenase, partial [Pseudomonas savastanoi]
PAHAGLNKANPSAMFLAIAMMLEYLGYPAQSDCITRAVSLISRSAVRTYDMGGSHTTRQVGEAIVRQCMKLQGLLVDGLERSRSAQGERHVSAL